ncbi:MAG: BolA/IbaG family iron-sulfur metabolism protein [Gammaproteobacteria bacterium]|nr:BolA/IbaG family iron-sulfur metabolism protein [Gammaproteobacteria bacterium]
MSLQDRIEVKVNQEIKPQHFDLINESHMHSGPATESHFKLIVVAEAFNGLSAVKRHQRLYAVLADELRDGVHALALHLYTPPEWAARQASAPDSPDCRGGSKHA